MIAEILKLKELISIVPLLLNYVAPGYIFYSIKNFQFDSKRSQDSHIVLKSIIVSFCINSILNIFISDESNLYSFIAILISIAIALIYINIIEREWLVSISHKLNLYKSVKNDLLSDIVDSKLGMWLRVYIEKENVIYMGKLINYENVTEDGHRYIVLSCYCCYSYDGDELSNNDDDHTQCVLLNLANIDRVEMIYDRNSKKIREPKKETSR